MQYPIIVRTESPDRHVAQPVGLPELRAMGRTETEAVLAASRSLERWLASAKLVLVDVAVDENGNPWLSAFGRSADDPDFAELAEEIARARSSDARA